jgi:hypothetical protein
MLGLLLFAESYTHFYQELVSGRRNRLTRLHFILQTTQPRLGIENEVDRQRQLPSVPQPPRSTDRYIPGAGRAIIGEWFPDPASQ